MINFVVLQRRPFAVGLPFGSVGPYERIDARAEFAIDPNDPAQAGVFDIDYAPTGPDGLVRFSSDVFILKPVEPDRGRGAALLEFPNRGNKRCLQFFNNAPPSNDPLTAAHAGDGFLMREGYTVICAAWQGDVLRGDGRLVATLPIAGKGHAPLTARIRAEFISDTLGVTCLPLSGKSGTRSHPTVSFDSSLAEFRRRRYPWSKPEPIAPDRWSFSRIEGGGRGGAGDISGAERAEIPSDSHIHFPEGFKPGWIYDLIYTARDPLMLDLGFVGIRDLVSFLRHNERDANPLAVTITRIHGWGRSQSGRCIRDFVHRGFNVDAGGLKVFDGMLSHVAGAGRTAMNRFSNLVVAASRQYEDWLNPADRFPFSYAMSVDHITGRSDGIMKRPESDPLLIHTQTASEYWHRRGSLVHTDSLGADLAQPDNVRIYFWSSSQHWSDPIASQPSKGVCQNYQNIVATSAFFRATLMMIDMWARDGTPPPPSRIPRVKDHSLVDVAAWRRTFPAIPGVALPARPNELPFVDYGAAFEKGGTIDEPPSIDAERGYAVRVPAVDADGNDLAGLRAPMVSAPLGTYTGWNLRVHGWGAGALHDFSGSYIPFPETQDERELTRDPRISILERYRDKQTYTAAIQAAAEQLQRDGFLVAEDVARAMAAAADWGGSRHIVHLPED